MRPRVVFRLGDIRFSKDFINALRSQSVIISRRDSFNKPALIINHGNSHDIRVNAIDSYLINKPRYIHYCSNKKSNMRVLKDYYPKEYNNASMVKDFPVVVKAVHGLHGTGVKKANNRRELKSIISSMRDDYLIEEYINIKGEYRFNIFDGEIYQISKKEMVKGWNGRFVFEWHSLGSNAKLHPKFYDFIDNVITDFHKQVGHNLGSYAVDVLKSENGKYYLSEFNSAFGIGELTMQKLMNCIFHKYNACALEKYKVR